MIMVIIAIGLYVWLAFKRQDWALLLIIASLPSYLIRLNVFGVPTTFLELMVLSLFGVFVVKNYSILAKNVKSKINGLSLTHRYPFDWEMVLFLILGLVAVGTAGFNSSALGIFKAYFFEAIIFYILFVNIISPRGITHPNPSQEGISLWGNMSRVIWALAISALSISVIGFYQKFFDLQFMNPIWSQQGRITSFFPYSNAVGLFLGPIVILLTAYLKNLLQSTRKNKLVEMVILLIIIVMSIMTISFAKSEGAMLGVLVGLFILAMFTSRRLAKLSLATVAVTIALVISLPQLRNFAIQKLTLSDLAGEIRKQQWRETGKMLTSSQQNFLFGVGLSGFPTAVKPFHQEGIFFNDDNDPMFQRHLLFTPGYKSAHWQPVAVYQYPHNLILNFWVELGLLGVILAGWLLLKFMYYASLIYRKKKDFLALGLLSAMSVWLVNGLVDVPYFKNDLALLGLLMFAMLGSLMLHYERSITKNNCR